MPDTDLTITQGDNAVTLPSRGVEYNGTEAPNELRSTTNRVPAISNLDELLDGLSADQRELLELLMHEEGLDVRPPEAQTTDADMSSRVRIPTQPRVLETCPDGRPGYLFPVSFSQQRMWFLDQWEPGSALYNIPSAVKLSGQLDPARLEDCLNEIVRQHESLRTSFGALEGQPFQVVSPELEITIPIIDLNHLPAEERLAHAMWLAAEEARQPFDLKEAPLLRVKLLRLAEQENIALLTMHHIISDGWSMGVLIRELAELYQAFSMGEPGLGRLSTTGLKEPALQYADFAVWQKEWLQGPAFQAQKAYWKSKLGDGLQVLSMPVEHLKPAGQRKAGTDFSAGSTFSFELSGELQKRLQELARQENATLFMTLLAAFQVLLYRYTGQSNLTVGTPVANRRLAQTENLIGFFANTLVLRSDLSGSPGFRDLLRRVRLSTLEAYDHQDLPFEMLVEELHPERDLSHSPLFQVMFTWQNAPAQAIRLPGLTLSNLVTHSGTSKFDLTLVMAEEPDRLSAVIEYRTSLFGAAMIARLAGHFQVLLEGIVDDPNRSIDLLPMVTEAELHQVLLEWNADNGLNGWQTADYTIHELFERQAASTPDAPALNYKGQMLSYAELDRRANCLANYLCSMGLAPGALVGVCVNRSHEMIVALLGILKAGGCYLPIDPYYPVDRQAFMLADSQAAILLTQSGLADSLGWHQRPEISELGTTRRMIQLDADWYEIESYAGVGYNVVEYNDAIVNDRYRAGPDDLAYAIYTSGSTGRPKGVLLRHRGLVNFIQSYLQLFDIGPGNRFLQFASHGFDASLAEIFTALLSGATLYLADRETLMSMPDLGVLLSTEHINAAILPPTVLALLPAEELPDLNYLMCAGERCSLEIAEKWAPGRCLFNGYGPTEATIGPTIYRVDQIPTNVGSVPIGRPLPNIRLYLLDTHSQPVPVGVPGEICLGGNGLALGYLGRPDLTAERFIPDAFTGYSANEAPMPGDSVTISPHSHEYNRSGSGRETRLYRTGDLGRYLPDGNVEFLGRVDDQVKIRGFRIELGEAEAVLCQHPAIQEGVVIVREDPSVDDRMILDQRLVAFYVRAKEVEPAHLRQFMSSQLPDYMLPSAYIELPDLPLTPNGKIDRRALASLPLTDLTGTAVTGSYIPPRTAEEEILAGIWAQVLKIETVGVDDNFFEMGGHSLLATQLLAHVYQILHVEIPLRRLFESPTVAGLAGFVALARQSDGAPQPLIRPLPRQIDNGLPLTAPPLSFAQQRLWFLDQFEPGTPYYNIPTAVRLTGRLKPAALEKSLNAVIHRHEILRTTIANVDGRATQSIAPELVVQLPLIDLSGLPDDQREAEARRLVAQQAWLAFDLAKGPLLRPALYRLGAEEHLFLLTMHHIISDGWSTGVLVDELSVLYPHFATNASGLQGEESSRLPLPDLDLQYADYAVWQREWLSGAALEEQLSYWKNQLAGLPPVLELPTDRPRPPVLTQHGANFTFGLGHDLTAGLHRLSQQEGVTLFMTLLAAFQVLLYRTTGQTDLSVGTPIANRRRVELEKLIGFFVNTLVLRADLSGGPGFRSYLSRVRETALGAYAHQDVPFEMLVDALQPDRNTSHTPLFQVMFVLQNLPRQGILFSDLRLDPLEIASVAAKFDLMLTIAEGPDGLSGSLEYNTDLFDAATIQRMAGHYQALLEGIVADPNRSIDSLSLLAESERRQLLVEWNNTHTPFIANGCLHELFEEQVERTPFAPAIVAPITNFGAEHSGAEYSGAHGLPLEGNFREDHFRADSTLNFSELNGRANQLANYLLGLGLGPETLVGLMVERSVDMFIGVLGILKAGSAYVPLDPSYPPERLAFILEDAHLTVLLTQAEVWGNIQGKSTSGRRVICLDSDWETLISPQSHENPVGRALPENLAYVIYTSGSTGKPKGVMIEHRSAVNLWQGLSRAIYSQHLAIDPVSGLPVELATPLRVSLNAPLLFDASVQEWLMLLSGHTLYILPQLARQDGAALLDYIREKRLDVLDCVPSQLKLLIEAGLLEQGEAWKPAAILPGGEAIEASTWQALCQEQGIEFYNMYGPTECTVDSTICDVKEHPLSPSIGRPVANTRLFVLDAHGQPVPVGVPGELYIGGAGVGRGYLSHPELTAERFVPNPFVGAPTTDYGAEYSSAEYNAHGLVLDKSIQGVSELLVTSRPSDLRLYRTGDRVRYLADGQIEFLGRIDFQVKLRGFRIELGEIEAVLAQHPQVDLSVVLMREDRPGEQQLVAYLVEKEEAGELNVTGLRSFLRSKLPEYMVPSIFVTLPEMPLTPNAKIDRKALPRPDSDITMFGQRLKGESAYVAPRSEAEVKLADIWAEVLGLERVGINDNFFELGGDSIISLQIISKAQQAGLGLTPRQIFEAQTIAGLAVLAEGNIAHGLHPGEGVATDRKDAGLEQGVISGQLPLTPIQHWFFEHDFSDPQHWNQALLLDVGARREPSLNPGMLTEIVRAFLRHHDALRLRFKYDHMGWQATIVDIEETDELPIETVDLQGLSVDQQRVVIEEKAAHAHSSLDLRNGPLIRVVYFQLGNSQPGRLLVVIHHLAVDGVSWRILIEDFQAAYLQISQGRPVSLPPKTTSYRAWADKLAEHAASPLALSELDYWLGVSELLIRSARAAELPPEIMFREESQFRHDYPLGKNLEASANSLVVGLDAEETETLLHEVPPVYGTEINDALLTALAQAYARWSGSFRLLVALEGHGRGSLFDDVDLSRTIGWFTTIYPLCLELKPALDPGEALKSIKEQIRQVPRHGTGYGMLRYLSQPRLEDKILAEKLRRLAAAPDPDISFNYLGQMDRALWNIGAGHENSFLGLARESSGPVHSPRARRPYLLEVNARVASGRLEVQWTYSVEMHKRETIELLAGYYLEALRGILAHCRTPQAGGYTPSDFSLAKLDQSGLDRLLSKLNKGKR